MHHRRLLHRTVLALLLAAPGAGCAVLRGSPRGAGAEPAPNDSSFAVAVENANESSIRLFVRSGAGSIWIGTVDSEATRTLVVPVSLLGGVGITSITVQTLRGETWEARSVLPRAGTTIRLRIDRDLSMSTWSSD